MISRGNINVVDVRKNVRRLAITSDGLYLNVLTASGNIEVFRIDAARGGLTQAQVLTGLLAGSNGLVSFQRDGHPLRASVFTLEATPLELANDSPNRPLPTRSLQLRSQIAKGYLKSCAKCETFGRFENLIEAGEFRPQ
jgi:hypothetical protein